MELLSSLDPLTASAIGGAIGSIVLMIVRQYLISQRKDELTAQQLLQKSRERSDDLRKENERKGKIISELRSRNYELKRQLEAYKKELDQDS